MQPDELREDSIDGPATSVSQESSVTTEPDPTSPHRDSGDATSTSQSKTRSRYMSSVAEDLSKALRLAGEVCSDLMYSALVNLTDYYFLS